MPEFSVIVPVYKVEKYLDRCICSILNQTFSDFELILIDDGSPDNSGAICDQYAAKDNRVRVIHKENGGVSSARNAGLNAAQGTYIAFVDSDDEVAPNYIELLNSKRADAVVCGVTNIDPDNQVHHQLKFIEQDINVINSDCVRKLYEDAGILYVYSKAYRRSIIEEAGLRFNDSLSLGEDTLFFVEYLLCCRSLSYVQGTPYIYHKYKHETLTVLGISYVEKIVSANSLIFERLQGHFHESFEALSDKIVWDAFYEVIFSIIRNNEMPMSEKLKTIRCLTSKPEFKRLVKDIDVLMPKDAKKVRMVVKTGIPTIILYMLTLFDWIGKHKKSRAVKSNFVN